ncbi:MAG TPA: VTT domain-containing protein [Longimicrobiaceae bacterium]|nr:VTT domain-containing protein [Longimicrobiaceae bacterium]
MRLKLRQKYLWKVIGVIAVLGLVFWLTGRALDEPQLVEFVSEYGYPGIFAVAVFSGFSLLVPIPAASFTSLLIEAGLSLPIILTLITLGMTLGDCVGFLLGKAGRSFSQDDGGPTGLTRRLDRLRTRHPHSPSFILFAYAAFVPLPNELVVAPLSFLGMRFWHFFLPVLLGNALFNSLVAAGIVSVFDLLDPRYGLSTVMVL